MHKHVKMSAGARPRLIQQPRAAGFETRNGNCKIGYFDGDVMQTLAALVDELGDYRIRFSSLEQLDARFARWQHGDRHLFLFNPFTMSGRKAELRLVKYKRGVQRSYGDTEVINLEII